MTRLEQFALPSLLACACALVLAPSASAGLVTDGEDERELAPVSFMADPGEVNTLTVTSSGSTVTFTDATAPIRGGGGRCVATGPSTVVCQDVGASFGGFAVAISTADGSDTVDATGTAFRTTIEDAVGDVQAFQGGTAADRIATSATTTLVNSGSGGDDDMRGSGGTTVQNGGAGNDRILAAGTDDTYNGGDGHDRLGPLSTTPAGPDTFNGDGGFDRVDYAGGGFGVTASIDGMRNDGDGDDDVRGDVEALTGSAGPDVLTGSDGPNTLDGQRGDDTLDGANGNDFLGGGIGPTEAENLNAPSPDVFVGGQGADTVTYSYLGQLFRSQGIRAVIGGGPVSGVVVNSGGTEGDTIGADVERLNGSNFDDELSVDPSVTSGVTLVGFNGTDTLTGGAFADFLDGGRINDFTRPNLLDCGPSTGDPADSYRKATDPIDDGIVVVDCEIGI